MEPSRDINRLVEIMAALRNPDGGCPWDLEQDFSTIAPYTIEEAYEVADAIERDDPVDLKEELGDLLLQVVYHAQLGAEAGWFSFEDVVEAITKKMIRRHPHVFGDAQARTAGSAKGQWERIKAEEKAERAADRLKILGEKAALQKAMRLDNIPSGFPALTLALKIQKEAARAGFDWAEAEPIFGKIEEETQEFREVAASGSAEQREEELGDLVFSVVNLARFYDVDPEKALRTCVAKFRRRFEHIETALAAEGKTLEDASLDEMEAHWVAAKRPGGR
ncbi:nucleoside triphosphate pyrophosphohydrolase [Fulvimarina sp. 2208YS6-2-32]|uniref:Nucleoside triphosphate pyrophosphohydrolase n=1 Tax=Fulvimarina uroteuthidis TaxID=3098149 RepID=A0ABU5I517_9HYPH|nr:nucleoside triphosphate pyrophosphohydrolase [Fulvimarina sp. 2208YS6-2-32]MDY8110490.1 nucleoside triphosphate pyrophosphohydrolase [Fulvimarina sp. 2208YS6-2-32]